VELLVNGQRVRTAADTTEGGTSILRGLSPSASADAFRREGTEVTLQVARTQRPIDLRINDDPRSLGVAVNWVEFSPVGR
jgi:hypothetical protein